MVFWRTYNNKLYPTQEVDKLGFHINDSSYIPDEYLEQENFIILRTCFGLGDWGIISALPRKLKEKYPNSKVWIPSPKLLKEMFGELSQNWSSWSDPFQVVHTIFNNNPYVDGFVDSFEGDVFNDHYRIYKNDESIPLIKQMLRFWQFDDFNNIDPELYWTDKEKELANNIIQNHCNGEFGTLLISNKYKGEGKEKIQSILDNYNLPMFYWISSNEWGFNFNKCLDLNHLNVRIQLLIKSLGTFSIGNQTGANDIIPRYTKSYIVPREKLGSNFINSVKYV